MSKRNRIIISKALRIFQNKNESKKKFLINVKHIIVFFY